jgi:hypothetical protein
MDSSSILPQEALNSFIAPRMIPTYVIVSVMAVVSCRLDIFRVWLAHYKHSICIYTFTDRESEEDACWWSNTLFLVLVLLFHGGLSVVKYWDTIVCPSVFVSVFLA